MHDDFLAGDSDWCAYLSRLAASGEFQGGSAIGGGLCARKNGAAPSISSHLSGFIRIQASSLADAQALLPGNPVFEAGGTVEIRVLPQSG